MKIKDILISIVSVSFLIFLFKNYPDAIRNIIRIDLAIFKICIGLLILLYFILALVHLNKRGIMIGGILLILLWLIK